MNYKHIIPIVALLVMILAVQCFAKPEMAIKIDRFISSETCAGCHDEIFNQWQDSMHNQSHNDPVYNRLATFLRQGLTDKGEILEAESCVKCHTPVGNATGYPEKLSDDLSKTPEIAKAGIQCDYCHSAVSVKKMYNNGLVLNPGHGEDDPGAKYGPFDDSEPDFHEAAFSKLHTESAICGTCHDVKHVAFGTNLETTYTEWLSSPYNSKDPAKRVTCQGCHMYQKPGVPATGSTKRPANPGSATNYSQERPHIFTHYFVGGNSAVPESFGNKEKALMAQERLQNAASLSIGSVVPGEKKLSVKITNDGAGHSLPTGLGDLRQVWLEISVSRADNKVYFSSGVISKSHEVPDDARIFRTVFGDGKGNAVVNIAKAREVLKDNRIKAGQSAKEIFNLPTSLKKGDTITVRLLYRSAPQKILKLLPGKPLGPLPVVEMARLVKKV